MALQEREEFVPKDGLDALERVRRVPAVTVAACIAERLFVLGLDHLLQHWISDVAQLERGRLGRDCDTVEDVRAPLVHAGEACLRGFVSLLLPSRDHRRAHDGVVDITEVQSLVAAMGCKTKI